MKRKDLINSEDYLMATINCFLHGYKNMDKKERKKIKKQMVKWIVEHRNDYMDENSVKVSYGI